MAQQQFISKATEIFSKVNPSAQFIVVNNYINNAGEVSSFSLCWRISYENAVQKSLQILKAYKPSIEDCIGKPYTISHIEVAQDELVKSFGDTILYGAGNNPLATSAHAYDSVVDMYGKNIPGVKIHRDTDTLHLTNLYRIHKVVHIPGTYKKVNSALKTLAKNDLRNKLPLRKFGQFCLDLGRFDTMTVQKITLKEEDMMRNDQ